MTRFVAFLRAVNVGGRTVEMARLRALFEALGFTDVETFIASGNVIFRTKARDTAALERRIEARLQAELGYEVATFLRADIDIAAIASHRPFPAAVLAEAAALNVGLLQKPLAPAAKRALSALATSIDEFHVHGREIYWLCRKKQSESKITTAALEKALGARVTFRNLNTMRRLTEKYAPS